MTVFFVGAGPGDPELLTLKAQRVIAACPVCLYAGSLVPAEVVAGAPEGALVRDTAPMTLEETHAEIVAAHARGEDVARVLAGQPTGHRYLLPDVCLSNGRFLDGVEPDDLPHAVEVVATDGASLRRALSTAGSGR